MVIEQFLTFAIAVAVAMTPVPDTAAFVAGFEGYSARAYNDHGQCSQGHGHRVGTGNCTGAEALATPAQARVWLAQDLAVFERCVDGVVRVPLTPRQRLALTSFAFNVGCGGLGGSRLLNELNRGHYDRVPQELRRWVYAGGQQLPGLVRRREAEAALWSTR
jgi:lysozyme